MNLRSAHENNVRSTRYLELAAVLMHRVSRRDSSFSPIQEPHPDFRNPHSVPGIGSFDHQGPRQQERWAEVGLALGCCRQGPSTSTVTRSITEALWTRLSSLKIQHPDRRNTKL